jgi:starch phosphorylase
VVCVQIERRNVLVRAWRYVIKGVSGGTVPVLLLDTDLFENREDDRSLTDHLYGGDPRYRLCQEVILGLGGLRMLRALGYNQIERYHLNEGHAALLALELLNENISARGGSGLSPDDIAHVRRKCVFTTHTPVPAGHDQFPVALVNQVLGRQDVLYSHTSSFRDDHLNMTYLALNLSGYVNAVSKRHADVSRAMFPEYTVDSITNGVHAATWSAEPFQALFDKNIPHWRADNFNLRGALAIARDELWNAHQAAKTALVDFINKHMKAGLKPDVFTLGFARRAATYKRANLLVSDIQRLKAIAAQYGMIQIVYAGKAHPRDAGGKEMIRRVHEALEQLAPEVIGVYLPNYEMAMGRLITAGVDVWVNTPERPLEASGTSGMKAALNGVPSLSVLDGWWIEGCVEGVTGWAVGPPANVLSTRENAIDDANSLYEKLQNVILPMYHHRRDEFIDVMRHCIALNGSYFNTQRMVQEYVVKAYCR